MKRSPRSRRSRRRSTGSCLRLDACTVCGRPGGRRRRRPAVDPGRPALRPLREHDRHHDNRTRMFMTGPMMRIWNRSTSFATGTRPGLTERVVGVFARHLDVAAQRYRADAMLGVAALESSAGLDRTPAKTSARERRDGARPRNGPARGRIRARQGRTGMRLSCSLWSILTRMAKAASAWVDFHFDG